MVKLNSKELAPQLDLLADILEFLGKQKAEVLGYRRAARVLAGLALPLDHFTELVAHGTITTLDSNVVKALQEIDESVTVDDLHEEAAALPAALRKLIASKLLPPKKLRLLHHLLGVSSVAELKQAGQDQRLLEVSGFNEKKVTKLLAAIEHLEDHG